MRKCQNEFALSRTYNSSKQRMEYMCPKGFGINIIFDESLSIPNKEESQLELDSYVLKSFMGQYCEQCQYYKA